MNNKGFTLIELMIVVVIIGILAAIAVPNFIAMQDRAKEAKVKSVAHTVQLAAEDYAVRNDGLYSVAVGDLTPLFPGGGQLENAFTGVDTNPIAGVAAGPGEVGIQLPAGLVAGTGYEITGYGKDANSGPDGNGIVIALTNGS